ncbi:hypothetical protein ACPC37_34685 [Streptomyces griseoincarnatus]|uniref:hypothetical protein n=1 Tax=Paenibacillus glucanolyticus TaxID=59843 RepID=UPI0036932DC9
MGAVVQMEIYPSVTDEDKLTTRALLRQYPKIKALLSALAAKEEMTPHDKIIYAENKRLLEYIDMAVGLILDDEVKRIIEHRFFRSRRYTLTSIQFRSIMSERTIDRRIDEGVETIAESLKLCGIL